eukprot:12357974-Prorocentrum_lima.AAC.1
MLRSRWKRTTRPEIDAGGRPSGVHSIPEDGNVDPSPAQLCIVLRDQMRFPSDWSEHGRPIYPQSC